MICSYPKFEKDHNFCNYVYSSLQVIVDCLSEHEVGQTEHTPLLRELLLAVGVVTEAAIVLTRELSFKLFTVTLRAEASNQAPALRGEIDRILALLTSRQGHASTQGLYQDHTHQILQQLAVCCCSCSCTCIRICSIACAPELTFLY